jgi:hypothetical protein
MSSWKKGERCLVSSGILLLLILCPTYAVYAQQSGSTQDPNPNLDKDLNQETPQEQKQEAEKPDAKASAGDLAKATQNPVASFNQRAATEHHRFQYRSVWPRSQHGYTIPASRSLSTK